MSSCYPNRLRGEISAALDGRGWILVLTLGALAELESAFDCPDLNALLERLGSGRLSASDLISILGAGLRGAGNDVSDDQVAMMRCAGGASGYASIVADLLHVTFGKADDPVDRVQDDPAERKDGDRPQEAPATSPFVGSPGSPSPSPSLSPGS